MADKSTRPPTKPLTPQERADAINQLNVLRDAGRASPEAVEKGKQKIREQGERSENLPSRLYDDRREQSHDDTHVQLRSDQVTSLHNLQQKWDGRQVDGETVDATRLAILTQKGDRHGR